MTSPSIKKSKKDRKSKFEDSIEDENEKTSILHDDNIAV